MKVSSPELAKKEGEWHAAAAAAATLDASVFHL
jgi:hypothetical protein